MKLSELVEHTGKWLGYSATSVGSYARFLREARQISGGAKGGAAANMTDDDKIALFTAVLGCGSARSCPKSLPALLSLKRTKRTHMSDVDLPAFFSGSVLKNVLLKMFHDIQNGSLDNWRKQIEHGLAPVLAGPVSMNLMVMFEIDADHASILLSASALGKIGGKEVRQNINSEMNFGAARTTSIPGFSRKIHEVSFERLQGWGTCLTD
jgi:hypothetical protein